MTTTPTLPLAGKSYVLRWDLAAMYRHQSLPSSARLTSDSADSVTVKAILELLWAALPREARQLTPAPETLAEALSGEGLGLEQLAKLANDLLTHSALNSEKKAAPSS